MARRVFGFDEKVLARLRQHIPHGDILAEVSLSAAETWSASVDVIDSRWANPENIDQWPGWSDGRGTLTYKLTRELKSFAVRVQTPEGKLLVVKLDHILA